MQDRPLQGLQLDLRYELPLCNKFFLKFVFHKKYIQHNLVLSFGGSNDISISLDLMTSKHSDCKDGTTHEYLSNSINYLTTYTVIKNINHYDIPTYELIQLHHHHFCT